MCMNIPRACACLQMCRQRTFVGLKQFVEARQKLKQNDEQVRLSSSSSSSIRASFITASYVSITLILFSLALYKSITYLLT